MHRHKTVAVKTAWQSERVLRKTVADASNTLTEHRSNPSSSSLMSHPHSHPHPHSHGHPHAHPHSHPHPHPHPHASSSSIPGSGSGSSGTYSTSHQSLSRPKGEASTLGLDKNRERILVGSLTNSYKFKPDGMMKKVRFVSCFVSFCLVSFVRLPIFFCFLFCVYPLSL